MAGFLFLGMNRWLYPWEWMFRDAFREKLAQAATRWIEPPWKAILSNKGMLALSWEMFPGHPNLLPAFFEDDPNALSLGPSFVRKPLLSREGVNIADRPRRKAPMAPKASSARRSHPCRTSPVNIWCSEGGWSITPRAGCRSGRMSIRSRETARAFCRTQFCEREVLTAPYRAAATALASCGTAPPMTDLTARTAFGR
jgi:hypothetical protein